MIGPKITTVFRSRWNALFWSAGVLATAYCSIPAPDDDTRSPDQDKAVQQVAAALKAQQSAN
jgi:hypothetical protein